MSEVFDEALRDHQNREAQLEQQDDADRAKEIERQIAILEPFWLWLAREIPRVSISSKIFHDYENAYFDFGPYCVSVKGDECVSVTSEVNGVIEWIYQRFLDQH